MKSTDIPASSRRTVRERDGGLCRLCGKWAGSPELHHIEYRSQARNRHEPENLVTLDYRCHRAAHTHPEAVRPALEAVVALPGTTGLQWLRWQGVDVRGLLRGIL